MPGKASQLLDMLGVDESRRKFMDAYPGVDDAYGESKVPIGKPYKAWETLFPPLAVET